MEPTRDKKLIRDRQQDTLKALCERSKRDMTITVIRYGDTIYSGDPQMAAETIDTSNYLIIDMQEEQHHFTGLPYMLIVRVIDLEDEDEYGMGGIIPPGVFG